MAEPSWGQLCLLQNLLGPFGNKLSLKQISDLVDGDKTKASVAITRLKKISNKESERINALPVHDRWRERKQMTEEEFRWVFS